MQRSLLIALFGLFLGGCAATATGGCPLGMQSALTAELFFGRGMGGEDHVADADWVRFVDEEVTPRFPEGLTIMDGNGQWREPSGQLARETAKVVLIVLPGRPDDTTRLEAVREAYKARFRQQSVLLVTRPACADF